MNCFIELHIQLMEREMYHKITVCRLVAVLTVLNSRSTRREIVDTHPKNHSQLLDNDHGSFGRGHMVTT